MLEYNVGDELTVYLPTRFIWYVIKGTIVFYEICMNSIKAVAKAT